MANGAFRHSLGSEVIRHFIYERLGASSTARADLYRNYARPLKPHPPSLSGPVCGTDPRRDARWRQRTFTLHRLCVTYGINARLLRTQSRRLLSVPNGTSRSYTCSDSGINLAFDGHKPISIRAVEVHGKGQAQPCTVRRHGTAPT
jgi:hypothetical protein